MEDVRPDDLVRAEREEDEQREPEEDAAPTEVRPTMNPPSDADEHGCDPVTVRELPTSISRRLRVDEALRNEPDRAEEKRRAEHLAHDRLHVVAVAVRELHADQTPRSDSGRGADEHPASEPGPDVPHAPVLHRADGLERGAVRDVGADRRRRRHAEEEDEERGHERAPAHPGHPDEEPRQQTEDGVIPVHRGLRPRR